MAQEEERMKEGWKETKSKNRRTKGGKNGRGAGEAREGNRERVMATAWKSLLTSLVIRQKTKEVLPHP